MRFQLATPVFGLPVRLVSDGGEWGGGFTPATFDRWQVTVGMVGCMGIEVRYCCGEDEHLRTEVLLLVLRILLMVDEATCTPLEIRRLFPQWTRRPIDRCPICLPRLRELAETADPAWMV